MLDELRLLLMLLIANASPVALHMLIGDRLRWRIDGGVTLADGQPLFGQSKTVLGFLTAVASATLCAPLLGFTAGAGAALGVFAMLGDLLTSFIKRRLGLTSSSPAPGLDQAGEAMLPLLACKGMLQLSWAQIGLVTVAFTAAALVISQLLYRLGIGQHPY